MNESKHIDDQVPSEDEDELSLAEGIDDEAEKSESSAGNYVIDSYGADYTVDSLVNRINKKAFIVPEFQRRFIWSQRHASRFIESLLMGLPVPGIFLYKRSEDSKHLVIDGQQRLKSLQSFYSGTFREKKFRLVGIRAPWEGKTYNELSADDQLRLDDSIIHTTIFSQKSPKDEIDSIHFVFERINSGGIRLSPQEIRNCIASGPFTKLIMDLNINEHWRGIYGPESVRAKDQELIVRSIALAEKGDEYTRPMSSFLTKFSQSMNGADEKTLKRIKQSFESSVSIVFEALGRGAFRPVRALNAAVLDSVLATLMSGSGRKAAPKVRDEFLERYKKLLDSKDYTDAWTKATADEDSVKTRLSEAKKHLLN
jgi:hypothetical protein